MREHGLDAAAQGEARDLLAPVDRQRRRAVLLVALGAALAVGAALAFGTREAGKLRELADGTSSAGVEVNSAAAQLSASSDELAATTTQQSAAVTQATATTEELARASVAIAETVDEIARQTAETRENLEQAEADITVSSDRTVALAGRVTDIDRLLDLINEIADQTNLLALNAAIEPRRGRGRVHRQERVRRGRPAGRGEPAARRPAVIAAGPVVRAVVGHGPALDGSQLVRVYAVARRLVLDSDPAEIERVTEGYVRDELLRLLADKLLDDTERRVGP